MTVEVETLRFAAASMRDRADWISDNIVGVYYQGYTPDTIRATADLMDLLANHAENGRIIPTVSLRLAQTFLGQEP